MKVLRITLAGLIALSLSIVGIAASDQGSGKSQGHQLRASLNGYEEVPSVSTPARGEFSATVARDGESFDYTLTFSGIASTVQQSHIHIAQPSVNGAIVIWLCQGATRAPAAVAGVTPECDGSGVDPVTGARTITGTVTAAQVLASPVTQQIAAGEFEEVLAAIRAGSAYANVHSATSPGGEIRGQVRSLGNDKH